MGEREVAFPPLAMSDKCNDTDQDLNGAPGDLGSDLQGLEKRRLFWAQTCVDRFHKHVDGCQGPSLGWGGHLRERKSFNLAQHPRSHKHESCDASAGRQHEVMELFLTRNSATTCPLLSSSARTLSMPVTTLTLLDSITSLISFKSSSVNTKPTFPLTCGSSFSSWGFFSITARMTFLMVVFFPINTTPLSRRDARICCICFEPTLSAPTMNTLEYSVSNC